MTFKELYTQQQQKTQLFSSTHVLFSILTTTFGTNKKKKIVNFNILINYRVCVLTKRVLKKKMTMLHTQNPQLLENFKTYC